MATTPNGLPFPTGTDNDVAYWLQQLAESLDSLNIDTGWLPLTPASGVTAYAQRPPMIRRIGDQVLCVGGFSGVATANNTAVTTIPATSPAGVPLRPPATAVFLAVANSAQASGGRSFVLSDGSTTMYAPVASAYVEFPSGFGWVMGS